MEEMWLVRNKNGSLDLFIHKPMKVATCWNSCRYDDYLTLPKKLFPEVQWSDEEPTKVKLEIVKQ